MRRSQNKAFIFSVAVVALGSGFAWPSVGAGQPAISPPDWSARLATDGSRAAQDLVDASGIDSSLKVKIIIFDGILKEIESPALPKHVEFQPMRRRLPTTDERKSFYVEAVVKLGPGIRDALKSHWLSVKNDELKKWISIALGFLGDSEQTSELLSIASSSDSTYMRALALNAVVKGGHLSRTNRDTMFTVIAKATANEACYYYVTDSLIGPGDDGKRRACPVKNASLAIAHYFGFKPVFSRKGELERIDK